MQTVSQNYLKSVIWFFNFSYTGIRKGSWQNQAKAHPVDQKQNSAVTQRGPPPRPGGGPRFDPQAVGRPLKDHFTSGAQQFGIRPMAPPGGGPAGRFSLRGPPFDGPLDMVPPHSHTGSTLWVYFKALSASTARFFWTLIGRALFPRTLASQCFLWVFLTASYASRFSRT